jgi:hypothetical protein
MGVTSKSVRLPVKKVHPGLAVATDVWFWSASSGNASYPCAQALLWAEQVQAVLRVPAGLTWNPSAGLAIIYHDRPRGLKFELDGMAPLDSFWAGFFVCASVHSCSQFVANEADNGV